MRALLLTSAGETLFVTRPRYAFGRFYVEQPEQDSIAFICPGDLIRKAIAIGSAEMEARGDGLGWHYPYHLRREGDGNTRTDIGRLRVSATSRADALDIRTELTISGESPRSFVVDISLDAEDLAAIGPNYTELSLP